MKDLELIVSSKETYDFVLKNQDQNLYDLYEKLDTENDLVQSSAIDDLSHL